MARRSSGVAFRLSASIAFKMRIARTLLRYFLPSPPRPMSSPERSKSSCGGSAATAPPDTCAWLPSAPICASDATARAACPPSVPAGCSGVLAAASRGFAAVRSSPAKASCALNPAISSARAVHSDVWAASRIAGASSPLANSNCRDAAVGHLSATGGGNASAGAVVWNILSVSQPLKSALSQNARNRSMCSSSTPNMTRFSALPCSISAFCRPEFAIAFLYALSCTKRDGNSSERNRDISLALSHLSLPNRSTNSREIPADSCGLAGAGGVNKSSCGEFDVTAVAGSAPVVPTARGVRDRVRPVR